MVIGFINQKGGVGKTTLAINLAVYAESIGFTTAICDLDPQSSLTKFYRSADNLSFKFAQSFLKDIKYKIEEEKDFDYYIVDTAGSANPDIFNNPYVKADEVSDKKEVVEHNVSKDTTTNTTIFQTKSKKTIIMLYLTEDNIKKLEDISKKYDRSVSDIINLI